MRIKNLSSGNFDVNIERDRWPSPGADVFPINSPGQSLSYMDVVSAPGWGFAGFKIDYDEFEDVLYIEDPERGYWYYLDLDDMDKLADGKPVFLNAEGGIEDED